MKLKTPTWFTNAFHAILPTALLLIFWNLSHPIWNPGGILMVIPAFFFIIYYPNKLPFSIAFLMFLLLDYTNDTLLMHTFLFLLIYGVLGIQNIFNLTQQKMNSWFFFSCIMSCALIIMGAISSIASGALISLTMLIWTIILTCCLYYPLSLIFNKLMSWGRK